MANSWIEALQEVYKKKAAQEEGACSKGKKMSEAGDEELTGDQAELDTDKDGDIDGSDLANLRAKKKKKNEKEVEEAIELEIDDEDDDDDDDEECEDCGKKKCCCDDDDDEDMDESSCSSKKMKEGKMDDLRDKMKAKKELGRGWDSKDDKKSSSSRKVTGKSYGGSKQKADIEEAKKMKGEDPCWDDYEMVGHKMKDGKKVPNCVKKESVELEEDRNTAAMMDMIGRLQKMLSPNSVTAKKVISTRGAGFKKDFQRCIKLLDELESIVDDIEMELEMNESFEGDSNVTMDGGKEKLEPNVKGEKKFKDMHFVKKTPHPHNKDHDGDEGVAKGKEPKGSK